MIFKLFVDFESKVWTTPSPRILYFLNVCYQFLIVLYALNNIFDISVMIFLFSDRWCIASILSFLLGLFSFLYANTTSSVTFVVTCYKSISAISVSFNLFFANLFWRCYAYKTNKILQRLLQKSKHSDPNLD